MASIKKNSSGSSRRSCRYRCRRRLLVCSAKFDRKLLITRAQRDSDDCSAATVAATRHLSINSAVKQLQTNAITPHSLAVSLPARHTLSHAEARTHTLSHTFTRCCDAAELSLRSCHCAQQQKDTTCAWAAAEKKRGKAAAAGQQLHNGCMAQRNPPFLALVKCFLLLPHSYHWVTTMAEVGNMQGVRAEEGGEAQRVRQCVSAGSKDRLNGKRVARLQLLLPGRKKKVIARHVMRNNGRRKSATERQPSRNSTQIKRQLCCVCVCVTIIIMKINISTLHVSRQLVDKRAK